MSTSFAERNRQKKIERQEAEIRALRDERNRFSDRAGQAIEARKEAEERAEEAYEAATEAMKLLDELLKDDWNGERTKRFLEIWKQLNDLSLSSSWVEDTKGIEPE